MSSIPLPTPAQKERDLKALVRQVLDDLAPNIQGWIIEAGADSPARGAELALKLLEFALPKLARSEITGDDGSPLVVEVRSLVDARVLTAAIPTLPAPLSTALPAPLPAPSVNDITDLLE